MCIRTIRFACLLPAFIATASLFGQTTGSIQGHVAAADGALLPNAQITATGALPGERSAITDALGSYHFAALPPGRYRLRAALSGFQVEEREAIVSLGATTTLDFRLTLSQAEKITVVAEVPALDRTSTEVGNTVDAQAFTRLPLSRDYTSIATYQPGVTQDSAENGQGFSVFGATGLENSYYIDGVDVTGVRIGSEIKSLPEEFLQEVEVKTATYSAEYGRVLGGVVNAITRSGGNEFHGEAFGYFDNESLQAKAKPGVIGGNFAGFSDIDFGASLGGYFLRDRLWFFGVYDRKELRRDVRLVTGSGSPFDGSRFRSDDLRQNLYAGKLTWTVSPSASVVGSVVGDPSSNAAQLVEDGPPQTREIHDRFGKPDVSLIGTAVGGRWAAELGLFRHQEREERTADFRPTFLTSNDAEVPTLDLVHCSLPGCYSGAPWVFIPLPPNEPLLQEDYHRDAGRGSFTGYLGRHEVKVGADLAWLRGTVHQSIPGGYRRTLSATPDGTLLFIQSWFGDDTGSFGADHAVRSVSGNPETRNLAFYAQDKWQVASNLTANVGLRYDEFRLTDGVTGQTITKLDNNFAPRVGVAWDPESSGRSKVTAAYGRFFEAIPMDHQADAFRGTNLTVVDVTGFRFDCGPTAVSCESFPNRVAEPADPDLSAPSSEQFSLGYQRELGGGFAVGVQAIFSRLDRAVEDRCDLKGNLAALFFTGNGCVLMNPGQENYGRGRFAPVILPNGASAPILCTNGLNPEEGRAAVPCPSLPEAKRTYRGISLTIEKRFSPGDYVLASYVYSRLRGNYDGTFNELGQSSPNTNFDFDYPGLTADAYGRLANDRPSQAKVAGFHAFPFGLAAGINAYYRSGRPKDQLGSFNIVQGAPIPVFVAPRGSQGRTPSDYDFDAHLDYAITLHPVTVDVIVDVFRVLNRQAVLQTNPFYNFDGFQADNGIQTNPQYGTPIARRDPRLLRLGTRVSF